MLPVHHIAPRAKAEDLRFRGKAETDDSAQRCGDVIALASAQKIHCTTGGSTSGCRRALNLNEQIDLEEHGDLNALGWEGPSNETSGY